MRRGYSLGGEQSGHVIYRRIATTGDGLLTGLRLLARRAATGSPCAGSSSPAASMTSSRRCSSTCASANGTRTSPSELADEIAAGSGARRRGPHPGARERHRAAGPRDGRGRDRWPSLAAQSTADALAAVVAGRFAAS
jgi:hypothetical protein